MKAQSLFIILLRIAGVFLIKDILVTVPELINAIIQLMTPDAEGMLYLLAYALLVFGLYALMIYLLLFKTESIVRALKLTRGLEEATLQFNMHRSAVYTIAFIVAGITILVMYIPGLIREIQTWLQFIRYKNSFMGPRPYEYQHIVAAIVQVLTGVFLIIYHPQLTRFIDSRRRAAVIRDNKSE